MWLWILFGIVVFGGFMAFTGAPYLPSKRRDIHQAFTELYPLGKSDTLVDIGAGDGVVLRAARRTGATVIGYEINPLLVMIARWLSRGDRGVVIHWANFWNAQLPDETTVVYVFGDSRDIAKMYQAVQRHAERVGKELVLISYGFDVPGKTVDRQAGAYYLYRIGPLHPSGASL